MELLDSRRLTGPNLLSPLPGALIDVALGADDDAEAVIAAWERAAAAALEAVGWGAEECFTRRFHGGCSLAFSAPIDALYAATELNEWTWSAVEAELSGAGSRTLEGTELEALQGTIADELQPNLPALASAARELGVSFCGDDEWTTLGMGNGSVTWATPEAPPPELVDWHRVTDRPAAMVTGTNGKTTTVRMLEAMCAAAELRAGSCSTDRIVVDGEVTEEGDWSGTGGARAVVKDRRVDVCLLETARGGLLRRGLGLPRVDVAAITNVAADHLGEMGVHDEDELCEVKFVVERAAERLVLNAEDERVRARGLRSERPVTWFAVDPELPFLIDVVERGGEVLTVQNGALVQRTAETTTALAPLEACPALLGGAALHNVSNALAAAGVALTLGFEPAWIAAGLAAFGSDAESNPGRLNRFEIGGATVLVDFAHNPSGLGAIVATAKALPRARFGLVLGQAGDREDASIAELAQIAAAAGPDRIVIKEMNAHARGREPGVVAELIESTLRGAGLSDEQLERADTELDAARTLLDWLQPGDLGLLLCHAQREEVLEELRRRR